MKSTRQIEKAYMLAKERYAEYDVNTDSALRRLARIPISLHCWQGDDLTGFESGQGLSGGGIQATGNYPGKARTADELRSDLEQAFRLIPGRHRVNLHAIYAETGAKQVNRNELKPRHFSAWIDWARSRRLGMDFNGTFFSHPMAESGFTLSSRDKSIRKFWIEHAIACRHIGAYMGKNLGTPCVTNIWIPDGFKDIPVDRKRPREILSQSLDEIFAKTINTAFLLDSVESKLFGLGSESYVVGSHEFYLAYAAANRKLLCMDTGHYHPTESISDKISSVLCFLDQILLHVSRGVRWDSDHVVILSDDLKAIVEEIVRGKYLERVRFGLDFFDASINRVAAWVIGTRCALKALLLALLEPVKKLRQAEIAGDYTVRLALLEELKTMPYGAVWDYYCLQKGVPSGDKWIQEVKTYEQRVQSRRGTSQ